MIAFNLSGIPVINIYANNIFTDIQNSGGISNTNLSKKLTFIGISNFLGAILSNFTVYLCNRRTVFIGGMTIVGFCMIGISVLVDFKKPDPVLYLMCTAVIAFQGTLGSACFAYATEVVVDGALGFCLMFLFGFQALQSLLDLFIIKSIGTTTIFYVFGCFQIITVITLLKFMKETKGLDQSAKKNLYRKNKI
jgi:hypothetical protein